MPALRNTVRNVRGAGSAPPQVPQGPFRNGPEEAQDGKVAGEVHQARVQEGSTQDWRQVAAAEEALRDQTQRPARVAAGRDVGALPPVGGYVREDQRVGRQGEALHAWGTTLDGGAWVAIHRRPPLPRTNESDVTLAESATAALGTSRSSRARARATSPAALATL